MNKSVLLFDEFEVKEHSTTETLKSGKKAFQEDCISNVNLGKTSLTGIFKENNKKLEVEIQKKENTLIGYINHKSTKPFSTPLTALAYWYINYINEHKQFASKDIISKDKALDPLEELTLAFQYDAHLNKINLTLYHPTHKNYCNESHLFIHSLVQLISHFEERTKQILLKLQYHYTESFFFASSWFKCDSRISHAIIQLIYFKSIKTMKNQTIQLSPHTLHLKVICKIKDHQILISFYWVVNNTSESISIFDAMHCEKSSHIIYKAHCYKIKDEIHLKIANQFHNHSLQRLDISKIKPFINKLIELKKKTGIELGIDKNIQLLTEIKIDPVCSIKVIENENTTELVVSYKYKSTLISKSNSTPYIIFNDFSYCNRNFDLEHEFRDLLLHYHPIKTTENSLFFQSPYSDQILGDILTKNIDSFMLDAQSKKSITLSTKTISPMLQFKSSNASQLNTYIQWIGINNEKMNKTIESHIKLGIANYFDKKTNTIIPIEHISILKSMSTEDKFSLPIGVALFLALNTSVSIKLPKNIEHYKDIFSNISNIKVNHKIESILRPFQNEGLKWLLALKEAKLGGILADDMGLGKTIQSIMLMKIIYDKKREKPSLIIMPKTLLFNWKNELQTFAPHLNVICYDGSKRKQLIKTFSEYHIILASFNTVRLDINELKEESFFYTIVDEAQYVKNHNTNIFKAIKKIKSHHRLLLTGTPIENSITDIWSLMDIANNNYFGTFKAYEDFYSLKEHQPVLKAAMDPFLLRRKKSDVLKDLPSVSIQKLWATPTTEEINSYTKFAKQEWQLIEKEVTKKGLEKSKIHIFSLMTKLRQWCAHPNLISETETDGPKWLLFFDRLLEAIATGHKIVIFSQFIPMINFMESKLNDENIPFVSLTGQTKNRENVIEEFNNNETIRIGIFSLKAGGVGINLTSADYVFLYDPWWNPAIEQQAIDRVHRIGQTNPVMVFKCLVASTIEERMIQYQDQKKELINSLIEEQSLNELDINEIKSLIGIF